MAGEGQHAWRIQARWEAQRDDLSSRFQMLSSTCAPLTRASRMVAFGLRPTSLKTMGLMFGESASWHCVRKPARPTFVQVLSGQQRVKGLIPKICDGVRAILNSAPSQDFQVSFSSSNFMCRWFKIEVFCLELRKIVFLFGTQKKGGTLGRSRGAVRNPSWVFSRGCPVK